MRIVSGPASKFVDGAPRLAPGVREVDRIESFFPSLLPLLVDPRKLGRSGSVRVSSHWVLEEVVIKGLALFVPKAHIGLAAPRWDRWFSRK